MSFSAGMRPTLRWYLANLECASACRTEGTENNVSAFVDHGSLMTRCNPTKYAFAAQMSTQVARDLR
jgi:hypothetical protein